MSKKVDETKNYTDGTNSVPYRLRIFAGRAGVPGGNWIAVISDLNSVGIGIAGVIEKIACQVAQEHAVGNKPMLFIEHCPERPEFEETFSLISFQRQKSFQEPQWTPLERDDVSRMIGECVDCGKSCSCKNLTSVPSGVIAGAKAAHHSLATGR